MNDVIRWAFYTIVTVGIGAIGFMLKDMKKTIEGKIKDNSDSIEKIDKKIETLEKDFTDYKERAAYNFVSKDEFIRAISNIDKKLDKIYDKLTIDRKEAS